MLKVLQAVGIGFATLVGVGILLPDTPPSYEEPTAIPSSEDTRVSTDEAESESVAEETPKSIQADTTASTFVKEEPEYVPSPAPRAVPARESSSCHPSYSGCLKMNAGDYDCASGSGNGPNYTGAVQVYGSDPFDLDRDNDGLGCE